MCGIFGYVGKENGTEIAIKGLKRLEYRGYDSAGVAGIYNSQLSSAKEVGKVSSLENFLKQNPLTFSTVIAHTRWATHGKPSEKNAHPHFDTHESLAIVHNGIIENYEALRNFLKNEGVQFHSETDTEVIAQLVSYHFSGNLLDAVRKTISELEGAYAIALIHKDFPDQMIAVAHESPLVIGIGQEEAFLSSDAQAFACYTKEAVFLTAGEIAVIHPDRLEIYNAALEKVEKNREKLGDDQGEVSKEGYAHYTLKEIFEQPQAIRNAMLSRYVEEYGTVVFEELHTELPEFHSLERILILACGTSWHAGFVAAYMIEKMARIPVQVEISSEFRYKNPIVPPNTLVIAISQSGETADTLAAVRELKAKGAKIVGLCNVHNSTLTREADATIFLRAGPEIGVCSTKAFVSQVTVLALFSLLLARMRHMGKAEGQEFLDALKQLPHQVERVLALAPDIQSLAKVYAKYENFFFLGRGYMYPAALEGALKLKEISYINANGYPAGEMKHGPIALINEECPTVAFCANSSTFEKMLSNVMEVKARSGKVIAIVSEGQERIGEIADHVIRIPASIDETAVVLSTVVAQLLAYYIALERGEDIDQPRNLAKSVTVE